MAHSALIMNGVFQAVIAERLEIDEFDPKAGALGAAFSGLVAYSYQRWVAERGAGSLADTLAASFCRLVRAGLKVPAGRYGPADARASAQVTFLRLT
jgi:hypothetical protein